MLSFWRKIFWNSAIFLTEAKGNAIIPYLGKEKIEALALIRKIRKESGALYEDDALYHIYQAVRATAKIAGDIAEVGTYRGTSAKVICEAKSQKNFHLFDRFEEGLPETQTIDVGFAKGQYATSLEDVKRYLKQYQNVYFYKGTFPETSEPLQDTKFSFVHLDIDIYKSTRDCLEFFYPRMNKGGVMISHDYVTAQGVRKAFDEFFADKTEPIIQISASQCLIAKA